MTDENYLPCSQGWKWGEWQFLWSPGDPVVPGPALAPLTSRCCCSAAGSPVKWENGSTPSRRKGAAGLGLPEALAPAEGELPGEVRTNRPAPGSRSVLSELTCCPAMQQLELRVGQTPVPVPGKSQTRTVPTGHGLLVPSPTSLQVSET